MGQQITPVTKASCGAGPRAGPRPLSLYEHRLNRTLEKAKAELKELQKERAKSREKALEQASEIAKLKKG